LKASLNLGLSETLNAAFPRTIPVQRVKINQVAIYDHWLAGFVSGEGSVYIYIRENSIGNFGVELSFSICQHTRDEQLMKSLTRYLDCGNVNRRSREEAIDFIVRKLSDINSKIMPYFKKYPILGVKALDFKDFCMVVELMKEKKHLTKEGLDQIRKIKDGMSRSRTSVSSPSPILL